MTVSELLTRATSAELSEWQAFFRLEQREEKDRRTHADMDREAAAGAANRTRRMRKR